jgi:hypothetical protein
MRPLFLRLRVKSPSTLARKQHMRPVESERIGHGIRILLACVFVVMVGFGITMPVLPFYAERLVAAEGAQRLSIAMHVSLLTSAYALMQLKPPQRAWF